MKRGSLGEHYRYASGKKLVPKKQFESKEDADYAIYEMKDKLATSYQCTICNKWHIGHLS